MNTKIILVIGSLVTAIVVIDVSVFGFPSPITPHDHAAADIKWEKDAIKDGNSAHNHRSARDFGGVPFPTNQPYSTGACWDNRTYHVDPIQKFDNGHCFIAESDSTKTPKYYFEGSWNSNAKARVKDAFDAWGAISSGSSQREIGIRFIETTNSGDANIGLIWENQGGQHGGGIWESNTKKLRLDSSLTWFYNKSPAGIPSGYWHFYSVALHEVGHVVGLADMTNDLDDLMDPTVGEPTNVPGYRHFDVIDPDSIEGVRDLYSQPVQSTCALTDPLTSLISLDGVVQDLGRGLSDALTQTVLAEDGGRIVRDEYMITSEEADPFLQIRHQGEHPANHNYAPVPQAVFASQAIELAPGATQRGWAVLHIGKSGAIRETHIVPADDGTVTRTLREAVKQGVRTIFADERRHEHTVYVPYAVDDRVVRFLGEGVVTLPMCCPDPCSNGCY